ncbi:MAG: tRNA (N6-isopentenyl adenosine(37)-C2)-methylthiotransferase MiaB [Christensenella sp.]|uniref:tRNA (N6-isopentenyl adenosine(37)-C2)-methylthiotransferase MiaB n=1 Tax=Christensenella sp. TaxID=1935934 RepID=UPI002B20AAE0|nr:tRNA (N6-isopentenyl adenosine(37)-C2)-methylthiotransferase MiaB [Christensenella sp.]MEA5004391.1 tRNA (N6-isopentenyl adenosine(37)-C2)-methylthiotransferase MiaB [Christensenella sp.]
MENERHLTEYVKSNGLKYHIITYGCQMNEHESEKIAGILETLGFEACATKENADFILFNTCCVRENAEHKTFGNVGALRKLKDENKGLMIAVCGCMMQQEEVAQKLSMTFPFVDIIFGTHNIHTLANLIGECILEKKRVLAIQDQDTLLHENVPVARHTWPLASVNIMYGCNNFCTYCIVPYVRGREKSRSAQEIIQEIQGLEGYQEIMLLGQNVNSYHGEGMDFAALLEEICAQTSVPRIRFMTSHPKDLSDALIDVIADQPRICRHIHLPVQSGSTAILTAMNRGYTREQYLSLVNRIRERMPDIALTTDVIVGFPGETDADFEDTISLMEKVRYDSAFTFVYSKREGTKAAEMNNEVAESVRKERIMRLVALQNAITEEKNKEYEGKTVRVLVEGLSTRDNNHVCGRTDSSKMVNFAGNKDMIGKCYDVDIVQGKKTTLFGRMTQKQG